MTHLQNRPKLRLPTYPRAPRSNRHHQIMPLVRPRHMHHRLHQLRGRRPANRIVNLASSSLQSLEQLALHGSHRQRQQRRHPGQMQRAQQSSSSRQCLERLGSTLHRRQRIPVRPRCLPTARLDRMLRASQGLVPRAPSSGQAQSPRRSCPLHQAKRSSSDPLLSGRRGSMILRRHRSRSRQSQGATRYRRTCRQHLARRATLHRRLPEPCCNRVAVAVAAAERRELSQRANGFFRLRAWHRPALPSPRMR